MYAEPEMMITAATDLAGIGSTLSEAHNAAAGPTVGLVPAAADEVSAAITKVFSQHAADYQALAAKAAAFGDQFSTNLKASAFSFTELEAALTAFLHPGDFLPWLYSEFGVGPVVSALADIELAILIPVLLLTSPIWIPLLVLFSPLILLFIIFAGVLAAA
jgi:hypothetical protein